MCKAVFAKQLARLLIDISSQVNNWLTWLEEAESEDDDEEED